MKKKYSIFQNIIFTHRYLLQDISVKYWLTTLMSIIGNVCAAFLVTYLPAYVIDLLAGVNSIIGTILKITLYLVLLCVVTVIYKRIDKNTEKILNNRRMLRGQEYYAQIMRMDYEKIDNSNFKTCFDAGLTSFYDGFHKGFHHIIIDFRTLLLSISGFITYIIFVAGINVYISLFLLLVSSISMLVYTYNETWVRKNKEQWIALDVKIKYVTREAISLKNAKEIRLYNVKDWFLDTLQLFIQLRQDWYKKELRLLYSINITERLLTAIKYFVAYFIAFENVKSGLEVSSFVWFIGLILGINKWLMDIFETIKYLQLNCVHVENTRRVLEMDSSDDRKSAAFEKIPRNIPLEIQLVNVSFAFPENETPIFHKLNLTISAGEKLAIVGNNGAGKSTLIKLICGLYQPTEGKILIQGIDIKDFKREEVYELFSVIFQDFNVLAASIAENVSCCTRDKTDMERVRECVNKAGLRGKISALPNGVESNLLKELDSNGIIFSGGEMQKLMIARCLYKDSPIMILDEPTSALDAIAEHEIYKKYDSLAQNKTSIFISHRLSSTRFCDRIILIDNGKILEEGTHDQLLEKNGEYKRMYEIQSLYYREDLNND